MNRSGNTLSNTLLICSVLALYTPEIGEIKAFGMATTLLK